MSADPNGFAKPRSLGSKARSLIPMTPRNLKSNNNDSRNDFARQAAEASNQSRDDDGQPPKKRFRSNVAPKGTKLASGYTDRVRGRVKEQEENGDDKQTRLKALEEMLKKEEIDQDTFDKLRDQLGIGGDTSSTHLVKGLDFKLLERVRRGEDVNSVPDEAEEQVRVDADVDVDDELEKALEMDVPAEATDKFTKQGSSPPQTVSTADSDQQTFALSRNEILRRLKENHKNSNATVSEAPQMTVSQPTLDQSKFRKLEPAVKSNKRKFTETINGRRREVLVILAKDGSTKRKTRWLDPEPDTNTQSRKESNEAWGADLPAELLARQKAAEEVAKRQQDEGDEDEDIFGGVTDYNPLAGIDSDEEENDVKPAVVEEDGSAKDVEVPQEPNDVSGLSSKPLKSTSQPRNYFGNSTAEKEITVKDPSKDPSILAALKRAAQIRRDGEPGPGDSAAKDEDEADGRTSEEKEKSKALLARLQKHSGQDDVDLDMGFSGDARYDEEDDGDSKQKLSEWKGAGDFGEDDDEEGDKKGGGAKRKRGGKKRKGDKNSFADVMGVLAGRKSA